MAELTITWNNINAWRLAKQNLANLTENKQVPKVVQASLGFQAQVLSASELAIYQRANATSLQAIENALNIDHTVIRTWAMRGTLHLLALEDLPLFVAARKAYKGRAWREKYFTYFGLSEKQYDIIASTVPTVLGKTPMTREELATSIANESHDPTIIKPLLASSWGSLWKPSAFNGDLCLGPKIGQKATFVNPRKFLADWPEYNPIDAIKTILRRYLSVYGPADPKTFAYWWELSVKDAKALFESIAAELVNINIQGYNGYVLKKDLAAIQNSNSSGIVRLLPLFDVYTFGLPRKTQLEPLLASRFHNKIFRPQGWISATVIVDGYIKGVWNYKVSSTEVLVSVELFGTESTAIKNVLEAEVTKLSKFFAKRCVLTFE